MVRLIEGVLAFLSWRTRTGIVHTIATVSILLYIVLCVWCDTVVQRPLADDVLPLFKLADKDGDGALEREQFQNVIKTIKGRYPQIDLYLRRRNLRQVLKDVYSPESDAEDGDQAWAKSPAAGGGEKAKSKSAISIEEFGAALKQVDAQLKGLPATAQVAAQQGEYLSSCFNKSADPTFKAEGPPRTRGEGRHRFKPFRYASGSGSGLRFPYLRLRAGDRNSHQGKVPEVYLWRRFHGDIRGFF